MGAKQSVLASKEKSRQQISFDGMLSRRAVQLEEGGADE